MEKQYSEEEAHDKAHDQANMMRADIGIDIKKTGKISEKETDKERKYGEIVTYGDLYEWRKINTDVTKEDYEQALEKIEEIEKLAREETSEEEHEFKLKKIFQLSGHTITTILLYMFGVADTDKGKKQLEIFRNKRAELTDAKTVLKKLIEEGKKFGKEEIEIEKQRKEIRDAFN